MCVCGNVLLRGRASVSVYAFDHVWLFVCTCVSAYVCFPAHVLMSGRVCLCVLRVQVLVCMFMRAHVCCPLMDYLYPRCDIYSRLSRRVQAGPRETRQELNVFFFWEFCLFKRGKCSLNKNGFLLFPAEVAPGSPGKLSAVLSNTASGRDWTSWVITAHPPSRACYPRNIHSLNTHKKMHTESLRHALLLCFCCFSLVCILVL